MTTIAIVPARMSSSRLPNKPMMKIFGIPMIGHCYYRTKMAFGNKNTFIATCDEEIFEYILSIGGQAIMTSNKHERATTRTAEASEIIENKNNLEIDYIVMVQGDEPLIEPKVLCQTGKEIENGNYNIVNVMCELKTLKMFKDRNNVKVVVDNDNNAIYFSREPIPSPWKESKSIKKYMQTGIIAFRKEKLYEFNNMSETFLEKVESVDMNRVIENGGKIKMVLSPNLSVGVDTLPELKSVEILMKKDKNFKIYKK